jgi:hypothetical protein
MVYIQRHNARTLSRAHTRSYLSNGNCLLTYSHLYRCRLTHWRMVCHSIMHRQQAIQQLLTQKWGKMQPHYNASMAFWCCIHVHAHAQTNEVQTSFIVQHTIVYSTTSSVCIASSIIQPHYMYSLTRLSLQLATFCSIYTHRLSGKPHYRATIRCIV